MLVQRVGVAVQPTTPNDKNISAINNTTSHIIESREKLKEQLGILLFHLHSTLTKRQRRMGWQLLEVLLVQYLRVKGEIQ